MKPRLSYLVLLLVFAGIPGCGGSASSEKSAIMGWVIGHGGNVTVEGGIDKIKKLSDLPDGGFEVQQIDLTNANITDQDLQNLTSLTELTSLKLYGTKITDEGLSQLVALTNLEELDLTNTNITDSGLKVLTQITTLRKLHHHATATTQKGLKEFHTALPECKLFPASK